jgi:hypothetical protein
MESMSPVMANNAMHRLNANKKNLFLLLGFDVVLWFVGILSFCLFLIREDANSMILAANVTIAVSSVITVVKVVIREKIDYWRQKATAKD